MLSGPHAFWWEQFSLLWMGWLGGSPPKVEGRVLKVLQLRTAIEKGEGLPMAGDLVSFQKGRTPLPSHWQAEGAGLIGHNIRLQLQIHSFPFT